MKIFVRNDMKNDSVNLGNHGGEDDWMEDDEEGGDDNEVFIMKSTWGLMMTANLANMSGRTVKPRESSEMNMNGHCTSSSHPNLVVWLH